MTPGARVSAAIEILDGILGETPAEQALLRWSRNARYAGSSDRRAIRNHVYQALRCLRSYAELGGSKTGRGLMIGYSRAAGLDIEAIFSGDGYAPYRLSPAERQAGNDPASTGSRWNLPDWLVPKFEKSLGSAAENAAIELQKRAPTVVRVNFAKADAKKAASSLSNDGIHSVPIPGVCTALQITGASRNVVASNAYKMGWIELQDSSSQAAMELIHVPEYANVLDYCAGGGGKTLALAARANANWHAHDISMKRMGDINARAARAGANVQILKPGDSGLAAPYDIVICDVPCSGSGAWRRNPQAKWLFDETQLDEFIDRQVGILKAASKLVKNCGLLAYCTCSILTEENERQVKKFMTSERKWDLERDKRWPISPTGDGFYLACLRRI
ncbi:MAG: RsmB/NOP family class I SAM-dependent RNA methyltransferase [Roseovarius sp.]|nr:RsmB/NOP family class I SAM-dependent RNA methyltransferase [Roseovarius sp.]